MVLPLTLDFKVGPFNPQNCISVIHLLVIELGFSVLLQEEFPSYCASCLGISERSLPDVYLYLPDTSVPVPVASF